MLTPLALFLGLLVATAFIAHWSDNLGKKLGKKRVSVFGLRPRTSATVLTVVSSWGIMMFTLLALLWTVKPLRQALLSIDSVRAKLFDVSQQLKDKETQLPVVQRRFEVAQGRLEVTEGKLTNANQQTSIAQGKVVVFQEDATKYQGEASKSRGEAEKARREFENARLGEQNARASAHAAQEQQKQAVASLKGVQTQLESSRTQVEQTHVVLERNQAQLTQAKRNVKQASQNLKEKQAQLKSAQTQTVQAEQKRCRAEQATQRAQQAAFRAQQAAFRAGNRILALEADAKALQASNHEARQTANFNGQLAESFAFGAVTDIKLPVDQTLAERHVDANLSPVQIENELRILADASQSAAQQFVPGARVIVQVYDTDPKTKKKVALSQKQTVESYARLLALANQPVSARLVSAFNYPDDAREVIARFIFVPMRTVYTAQQTIGEATIDATKSESAIFGQLERLVIKARVNAVKHGSNPPLSPADQNFFDGDTGQKMFDALRKVQHLGRPVPVRIVAARDLDATEPLQIRFQIGDASTT